MKQNLTILLHIAVLVLLLLFYFKGCGPSRTQRSQNDTIRVETVYRFDTVIHEILTHHIYWKDTSRLVMPQIIDSSQVVKDYFTQREFTDSLTDTNVSVTYSGMLWKNSLFNSSFHYKLLKPQTIITNNVILPAEHRNKIYVGGFLTYRDPVPSIGAVVSLQNKRDGILTLCYGTGPIYMLGYQAKISFKKRE